MQKPQQSRKRDSAAGTPFRALPRPSTPFHAWRGSPPGLRLAPTPASPHRSPAPRARPPATGSPTPRPQMPGARAGSPSCLCAPRLREPQRPELAPPALHARAPRRPEWGAGKRPGRARRRRGPGGATAPRPPPARTHRRRPALDSRRGPSRAAAGAAAGGEAGGPRPGAPGPCRRRVPPGAPATPPAAPRRRDKAAGPAGRGPPRALPAPRGPGEVAERGPFLPAWPARPQDARSLRAPHSLAHLLRRGTRRAGRQGPASSARTFCK